MKRWMMAASLCAASAGAFAQEAVPGVGTPAATVASETVAGANDPPETVLVLGQRPGPGMWKVSKDGHVLWVLGTYSPLPKQFAWRSRQVEAVIANSQGYLLPPSAQIGSLGFFKTLALLPYAIGIKKNPDGATLREVLSPEVYARWLPMRKKYFDDSSSVERERPMFVAEELYRRAIQQAGLDKGGVERQINEMVGKSKLKKTPVTLHLTVEDPASVLKTFKASRMDDAVCLASTLDRLNSDVDGMRVRAQAWANGNFAAIAAFDYESGERACSSALLESPALKELPAFKNLGLRLRDAWLEAAERLIGENVSTFATLPLDTILGNQGAIALLQARGYTVETPE